MTGSTTPLSPNPASPILRILVAEDHEGLRELSALYITTLGHHADCVATGVEAVEAVRGAAYDFVLMDMHMPVMDGLDAARAIRAAGDSVVQPQIVALTGSIRDRDREACLAAGMDSFIAKPFTIRDLAAIFGSAGSAGSAGGAGSVSIADVVADAASSEAPFSRLDHLGTSVKSAVLSSFERQGAEDVAQLEAAVLARDLARVRFLAHRLGGGATTIGAEALAGYCLTLETTNDLAQLDRAVVAHVRASFDAVARQIVSESTR